MTASADAHAIEPDRRKLDALDGVRGVAVLAVMASHFERFLPPLPWLLPVKAAAAYGWAGVDLFFALSGFLITGILIATRGAPRYFQSFYARRTLRIFPIYYLTLVAVLAAAPLFPSVADHLPPPEQRPLYFLYLTNWIPAFTGIWPPNVLGHFWSLAVEEQFYLVWPLLVAVLSRGSLRAVALGLAVLAFCVRIIAVSLHGPSAAVDLSTITRLDGLALGAFGAMMYAARSDERGISLRRWIVIPLTIFALGLLVLPDDAYRMRWYQTAGFSLLGLGFAALVTHLAFTDGSATVLQRAFRAPWLRRVGAYSYGMYVYHVPVLGVCEVLLFRRLPAALQANGVVALLYVGLLAAITFAVAAASYELLERRILRLKDRFRAGRA